MADKLAGGKGVVIFDGDDLIVDLGIQNLGDKARADALDLVRARNTLAQNGGGGGLDGDDLDVGILLLEELARAGQRAAGADAGDKDVDLCQLRNLL